MKKLISILLVSLLAMQMICLSVNAASDVSIVYDLGFAYANKNTTDITTRADFAEMLGKMAYYDDVLNYSGRVYTFFDVTETDSFYDEVEFLADIGAINGTGEGYFEPSRAITAQEAAKMLSIVLGYELMTNDYDYFTIAERIKLFKDVNFEEGYTFDYGNAVQIIYNALFAPVDPLSGANGNFSMNSGRTYIKDALDIKAVSGIVTDDSLSSISGETSLNDGYIALDSMVFNNVSDTKNILGRYVTVYYKAKVNAGGWYTAISIIEKSDENTVVLEASRISDYSSYTYKYENETATRTKAYNISKKANIRYNGRMLDFDTAITTEEFNKLMHPLTGTVTLVNSEGDNQYDFVDIMSYKSVVVNNVHAKSDEDYTIYDKFDGDNIISINTDDTEYEITDTKGNKIEVYMLKEDDVISYARSYDEDYVKIIVSNNLINTSLASVGEEYVTADDTQYWFSPEYKAYLAGEDVKHPGAGVDSTVYLSFMNEVVYIEQANADGAVLALYGGYILKKPWNDVVIGIYTQHGNRIDLTVDKSLKIDGQKRQGDKILEYFSGDNLKKNTLISVVYNKDNVVKSIDTPYYEVDENTVSTGDVDTRYESYDSLHYVKNIKDKAGSTYPYNYYATNFGGQMLVNSETIVFCVPQDAEGNVEGISNAFITTVNSEFFGDQMAASTVSAYTTKARSVFAEALVLIGVENGYDFTKSSYSSKPTIGLVTKIIDAIDANGEKIHNIWVDNGKQIIKYTTKNSNVINCSSWTGKGDKIEVGDIIKFMPTSGNVLTEKAVFVMYDLNGADGGKLLSSTTYNDKGDTSWGTRSYCALTKAYAYNVMDSNIEFLREMPTDIINYDEKVTYAFRLANLSIVIFDTKTQKSWYGDIADINPYMSDPANTTEFLYASDIGNPLTIFIYK